MTLKAIDPLAEAGADRDEVEEEPIPALCGPCDVARVLMLSYSSVMKLQRQGLLKRFELEQVPVTGKRYSGKKLAAYRNDEPAGRVFFGRKRA